MKIRVPAMFYDARRATGAPTPKPHARTARSVVIDSDDPACEELLSSARFYSDPSIDTTPGLRASARATVQAFHLRGLA